MPRRQGRWRSVLLAIVVVLLLFVIVAASPRVRDSEAMLTGFWSGEPAFLKTAELSEMYVYISPAESKRGRKTRQGYLVMVNNAGVMVSNQSITLEYSRAWARWASAFRGALTSSPQYKIPRVTISYDDAPVMPEEMKLVLNPADGTLAFCDDEKIYAFLVRDNEISLTANSEYDKE